jgi:hypothetical protein
MTRKVYILITNNLFSFLRKWKDTIIFRYVTTGRRVDHVLSLESAMLTNI